MGQFFGWRYTGGPFVLFSTGHLVALLAIVLTLVLIVLFAPKLREPRLNRMVRVVFGVFMLLSEASLTVWYAEVGHWTVADSLPLHLCSISLILSAIMLFTRSYRLFEFAYLAGLGGDIEALITPDLGWFSFPHYAAVQFFVAHGAIVVACFFMVIVETYRPTLRSIFRTLLNLNLYMLVIAAVNYVTGGNYLFLRTKPAGASLFDYLGPWPWYIGSLEIVAVLSFFVLYLPFAVGDVRGKRKRDLQ